jgi:hypothetical protein
MQVTRVCCQAASVSVSEPESVLPLDQKTVDLAHIRTPPLDPIMPYMHTSSITNTTHHTICKGHQAYCQALRPLVQTPLIQRTYHTCSHTYKLNDVFKSILCQAPALPSDDKVQMRPRARCASMCVRVPRRYLRLSWRDYSPRHASLSKVSCVH